MGVTLTRGSRHETEQDTSKNTRRDEPQELRESAPQVTHRDTSQRLSRDTRDEIQREGHYDVEPVEQIQASGWKPYFARSSDAASAVMHTAAQDGYSFVLLDFQSFLSPTATGGPVAVRDGASRLVSWIRSAVSDIPERPLWQPQVAEGSRGDRPSVLPPSFLVLMPEAHFGSEAAKVIEKAGATLIPQEENTKLLTPREKALYVIGLLGPRQVKQPADTKDGPRFIKRRPLGWGKFENADSGHVHSSGLSEADYNEYSRRLTGKGTGA